MKGYVLSDLHLFSRRSAGERILADISSRFEAADFVVLNGDTVDFRWASDGVAETNRRAMAALEALVSGYPGCKFYVLIGNHDNVQPYLDGLDDLARRHRNVHVERYVLKLGENIFLHGDVCNTKLSGADLIAKREKLLQVTLNSSWMHALYDAVIVLRLHRVAYLTHPKGFVCGNVLHYLRDAYPALLEGAKRIYFGHTHDPFDAHEQDGFVFYNTGSAIRGLRFNMLDVEGVAALV